MDYNQLLYFRSVAHLGNISRAAEMHYTTHSSISKSIARLEAELGVPLFNHRKGQIELNEMGRMFLASVEESVGALQQGINNVYNHTARESVLSLSCTLGDSVNPVITEMTKRHPELLFKVVEYGYSRLEKEFSRSDIDFAIITRSFTRGGPDQPEDRHGGQLSDPPPGPSPCPAHRGLHRGAEGGLFPVRHHQCG